MILPILQIVESLRSGDEATMNAQVQARAGVRKEQKKMARSTAIERRYPFRL